LVPLILLVQDDTGLTAKHERTSHIRIDSTPTAEPARKVFNPEESFENDRPRGTDLHLEIVVEHHHGRPDSFARLNLATGINSRRGRLRPGLGSHAARRRLTRRRGFRAGWSPPFGSRVSFIRFETY